MHLSVYSLEQLREAYRVLHEIGLEKPVVLQHFALDLLDEIEWRSVKTKDEMACRIQSCISALNTCTPTGDMDKVRLHLAWRAVQEAADILSPTTR